MIESAMLKTMKDQIGSLVNFYDIETGATKVGIPDVFFSVVNHCGWIELKEIKTVVKLKVDYEPGQQMWLKKHKRLRLNVFTLISVSDLFVLTKVFKDEFKSMDELASTAEWCGRKFKDYSFINALTGGKLI